MLSLHRSGDADLESANGTDSGGVGVIDGGEPRREIVGDSENNGNSKYTDGSRKSSASECSVEIVDLESRVHEIQLNFGGSERDCRICYLSLDSTTNQDSGVPIELGCSCKDDLAAAHKLCAEAWFKIRGNKTCEICVSIAQNVAGVSEVESMEHNWDGTNDGVAGAGTAPVPLVESRNFWQGHRFLNFLLACMVFAFVISWLFHFNVPS